MSFGAVAVDQIGPTWRWPGRSMLSGMIGNALGWDWTDRVVHQSLQDRLIVASALIEEGEIVTDTQNAQLAKNDKGWTTRGHSEGRTGASYGAPHRRQRDFLADADVTVVMTLVPPDLAPSLDDIHAALLRPTRPLFIGRKPCLPSRPLVGCTDDFVEAVDAHAALRAAVVASGIRAWWPEDEGPAGLRALDVNDLRNWDSGLHGGTRRVNEGQL